MKCPVRASSGWALLRSVRPRRLFFLGSMLGSTLLIGPACTPQIVRSSPPPVPNSPAEMAEDTERLERLISVGLLKPEELQKDRDQARVLADQLKSRAGKDDAIAQLTLKRAELTVQLYDSLVELTTMKAEGRAQKADQSARIYEAMRDYLRKVAGLEQNVELLPAGIAEMSSPAMAGPVSVEQLPPPSIERLVGAYRAGHFDQVVKEVEGAGPDVLSRMEPAAVTAYALSLGGVGRYEDALKIAARVDGEAVASEEQLELRFREALWLARAGRKADATQKLRKLDREIQEASKRLAEFEGPVSSTGEQVARRSPKFLESYVDARLAIEDGRYEEARAKSREMLERESAVEAVSAVEGLLRQADAAEERAFGLRLTEVQGLARAGEFEKARAALDSLAQDFKAAKFVPRIEQARKALPAGASAGATNAGGGTRGAAATGNLDAAGQAAGTQGGAGISAPAALPAASSGSVAPATAPGGAPGTSIPKPPPPRSSDVSALAPAATGSPGAPAPTASGSSAVPALASTTTGSSAAPAPGPASASPTGALPPGPAAAGSSAAPAPGTALASPPDAPASSLKPASVRSAEVTSGTAEAGMHAPPSSPAARSGSERISNSALSSPPPASTAPGAQSMVVAAPPASSSAIAPPGGAPPAGTSTLSGLSPHPGAPGSVGAPRIIGRTEPTTASRGSVPPTDAPVSVRAGGDSPGSSPAVGPVTAAGSSALDTVPAMTAGATIAGKFATGVPGPVTAPAAQPPAPASATHAPLPAAAAPTTAALPPATQASPTMTPGIAPASRPAESIDWQKTLALGKSLMTTGSYEEAARTFSKLVGTPGEKEGKEQRQKAIDRHVQRVREQVAKEYMRAQQLKSNDDRLSLLGDLYNRLKTTLETWPDTGLRAKTEHNLHVIEAELKKLDAGYFEHHEAFRGDIAASTGGAAP